MKDHVVSHLSPVSLALYRIYRNSVLFLVNMQNDFDGHGRSCFCQLSFHHSYHIYCGNLLTIIDHVIKQRQHYSRKSHILLTR